MFSRNKNEKTPSANERVKPAVPSIISSDLTVSGNIVSGGEVQIDGEVIGDIKSKVLLIGKTAKIKGEIFAETIHIHGNVNGQIKARTVHLAKSAHVVGDVLHENLSIDEGAFIEGHITRMNEPLPQVSDDRVNLVVNKGQPPASTAKSDDNFAAKDNTKDDAPGDTKKVAASK